MEATAVMSGAVLEMENNVELKQEERQACEIWTRVMGYHRPVASFNRGKQGEYRERQCFVESAQ